MSVSESDRHPFGGDWAFRYVYRNELPEFSSAPKLLEYPFAPDRHYSYEPGTGSLQDRFLFEVCGKDVENGVPCAPLEMGFLADKFYNPDAKSGPQKLDPEDEELMQPPFEHVKANDTWKATNSVLFIHQERINMADNPKTFGRSFDKGPTQDRPLPALVAYVPETAEEKKEMIKGTFDKVAQFTLQNIAHPSGRKNVHAVEMFPVFPELSGSWPDQLALTVFDTDPLEKGLNAKAQKPQGAKDGTDLAKLVALENAVLKPIVNPGRPSEKFMGYYAPNSAAVTSIVEKRKRASDRGQEELPSDVLQYPLVRDYVYDTSDGNVKQLVWRVDAKTGAVFYRRVPTRITYKRRRAKRRDEEEDQFERPTLLAVSTRPLDEHDQKRRRAVLKDDLGFDDLDDGEVAEATAPVVA
ncbi:RNA polymerase-associated factor [Thoreauomyces humboldtii]|nr:RNA polymerase-associated factor [Thoreauomyces humboldtii]